MRINTTGDEMLEFCYFNHLILGTYKGVGEKPLT